ncbi:MAG TPA: PilZ domain-containing protein [Polyangia bacterium]
MTPTPPPLPSGPGNPGELPREFPRYEVNAYVDYTGSEVLLYHRIQNISLGGVCIQSSGVAGVEDIGTTVELVINFPDLSSSLSLRGEVVWVNREPPMDMGIRYIDLDQERRETLRKYISLVRKT